MPIRLSMKIEKELKKYWWVLLLIVLGVGIAWQSGYLPFALSGVPDSDLLFLSGSPVLLEGENQPLAGDVVVSNFVIGIGNDIAQVGSYDKETISAGYSGQPKINYFVTAKKIKSNTAIKLINENRILRNSGFLQSGTKNGYAIGTIVQNEAEVQNSLKTAAQSAYTMMHGELGSNLLAFGWRPIEQSDVPSQYGYSYHCICTTIPVLGICASGWQPQVYWTVYEFGSGVIEYKEFGAKQANVQVDIELTNALNKTSSLLTLAQGDCGTNCKTEGYLYDDSSTPIGWAKIYGLLPSFELPFDLSDEAPALVGSTRYIISKNVADSTWNSLLALDAQSQGFSNWQGNFSVIKSNVDAYKSMYTNAYNSRHLLFSNKWSFVYNPSSESYVLNDYFSMNPTLEVVVKGNWIGLVRDVADFDIICGSSVEGYENSLLHSNVQVKNTSTVNGSYTVSWDCATGSRSIMDTLSSGAIKSYDVPFELGRAEIGTCTININSGSGNKTCGIGYIFLAAPVLCGNGRIDNGENCENCAVDVRCSANESCINQSCTVITTCGNSSLDPGETCTNCPGDLEFVNGGGYCDTPEIPLWLIALIIVICIGGLYFFVFRKKKKSKKRKK